MGPTPTVNPMSADQSAALSEFARACRAAARSVSLYPRTHPSIQASLSRVTAAAGQFIPTDDILLTVHPDTLVIEGRSPERPDSAIGELAALMHERLIGALRIERAAGLEDWHALLLLLARPTDELIADGGIGKAWAAAGRAHFEIREIDYAEVLRERAGGGGKEWDAIIALCLEGGGALDEHGLTALLEALKDSSRFGELIERLQSDDLAGAASVSARAAALITLVQKLLEATSQWPKAQGEDIVLQTAADGVARLTPDMLLALVRQTQSPDRERAQIASAVIDRVKDETVASFVANSIVKERGASERLAQALEALVLDGDHKERLLDLAKAEAASTPFGREASFEELWQSATEMLTSYSDERFVSADYARELSGARKQAVDVERVSDDPVERIQVWLATISDAAVKQLDYRLLLDLLKVESDPVWWAEIAGIVSTEVERRTLAGDLEAAHQAAHAIVREASPGGRELLRAAAESAVERLASGRLARHLVLQLRKVEDDGVEPIVRLCHTIGPRIIKGLADALMVEENARAIRRLRELLFGFGAAGRHAVEQLKLSPNPAVRRTAIELLRMFGGHEALTDLAAMLRDEDPQVQREAARALIHVGSPEAITILHRALDDSASTEILQELIGLRDEKVAPLLCFVLSRSKPRGSLVEIHIQTMEALGGLGGQPESVQTLRAMLYRGEWWAPYRTAALRRTAAAALRRIGTPDAMAVLEEAAHRGARGVRNAARMHMRMADYGRQQT
ncbi:MAG TPA: HEAT repeat domain-containing protein [Vicinamibacterales bacterium]